jgi:RNA exonuclease 4
MTMFFTKKQKNEMKARKLKKKLAEQGENGSGGISLDEKSVSTLADKRSQHSSSKKRPRPAEPVVIPPVIIPRAPASNKIIIPDDLRPKDSKKFRKNERRRARAEGVDENALVFMTPREAATEDKRPSKKSKKSFPRINKILKDEQESKETHRKEQERKDAEENLAENYKSRYLAVDCEMVGIGSEGQQSALARVSITNWNKDVVLDTFVKVPGKVTDFRTWVSGVQPKHLKSDQAMDVDACRKTVARLLKGKILVGHSLKNDLHALMLNHPKQDIRDTATYRPFQRLGGKKWRPRKLRDLVKQHVGLTIQEEGQSHDSVDDANATMDLFKVAREVWERELEQKKKKLPVNK